MDYCNRCKRNYEAIQVGLIVALSFALLIIWILAMPHF